MKVTVQNTIHCEKQSKKVFTRKYAYYGVKEYIPPKILKTFDNDF